MKITININQYFMNSFKTHWQVGHHSHLDTPPTRFIQAIVPGAVQLDFARSSDWPPYYYADQYKSYAWMESCYWTYCTQFSRPVILENQRIFWICNGIDYAYDIIFNGELLLSREGMFTPVQIDLTDYLKNENELLVRIHPAPVQADVPPGRGQAAHSVKPAVSYGWDWHPRLIPLGIWDEAWFEIRNRSHLSELNMSYRLKNLHKATIELTGNGNNLKLCQGVWEILDVNGTTVANSRMVMDEHFQLEAEIKNVNLWWPHDHGTPYLYTCRFTLLGPDECELETRQWKTGFRSVKLVMNEGAWDKPDTFPKSRSVPPIQLEINGRQIFCKGSNWVSPDIFPGQVTAERYQELLKAAKGANFNLLRVWGGSGVCKQAFYNQCDELGIMVWQDFPLACNVYPDTTEYLNVLQQEAVSIIKQLRNHPSLAIWCGGNELYNAWSGMTDQAKALRLLNSLTYEMDPDTPFIPTSPVAGMGHGHYLFNDAENGGEVFQWMPKSRNTAYTEFGIPGPSSIKVLESIIPPDQLFPPKPGTAWEDHHAYNAWIPETWLVEGQINHYFGGSATLQELVDNGQLLQAQGYKCIYEEARRQKPYCSMALNWCFNEPWPTAANNSLLNWPCEPKPALKAVGDACRPVLASAQLPKFSWSSDELFTCDLWMLNDSYEQQLTGIVYVSLVFQDLVTELLEWKFDLQPNENQQGPTVRTKLPQVNSDRFILRLKVPDKPQLDSEYVLLYRKAKPKSNIHTLLNQ